MHLFQINLSILILCTSISEVIYLVLLYEFFIFKILLIDSYTASVTFEKIHTEVGTDL